MLRGKMETIFVILTSIIILADATSTGDLRVPTTSGTLLGKESSLKEKKLRLFLGVPYAHPPTGLRRFKPPVEFTSPETVIETTRFSPSCLQPSHVKSVISPLLHPNRAEVNEDCLYLNIYVPDRNKSDPRLPVMVWLAGEGYDFADPQQYDLRYLALEGKAIVVSLNYRLSVFGFLTSLSDDAPGNVGLLDQRLALKWVRKNIERFGGQSSNVTLFGRLTGAMSAAIHAFSPLSQEEKLFENVILQSGVPDGNWAYDRNPLKTTYDFARAVNCYFPELQKIVDCLRNQPAETLLNTAMKLPARFRPTYDFNLIHENALKAAAGSNYAPINIMIGFNSDEGSLCTIALKAMNSPFYDKLIHKTLTSTDFSTLVETNMFEHYREHNNVQNMLAEYNYKNDNEQLRKSFIQFCGDLFIKSKIQKLADVLAQKDLSVFFYEFAHRPSFSKHPDFLTAAHGDDVLFALALPLQLKDLPEDEAKLSKRIAQAFTTFSRTGNPNTEDSHSVWPRYTSEKQEMMLFKTFRDNKGEPIQKSCYGKTSEFWNVIIPAVKNQDCPPSFAGLVNEENLSNSSFLGSDLYLPSSKLMVVGLIGISGLLLLIVIVTVGVLMKNRANPTFRRLP